MKSIVEVLGDMPMLFTPLFIERIYAFLFDNMQSARYYTNMVI